MAHGRGRLVIDDKLFAIVSWVSRLCGLCPVSFNKMRNNLIINTSRFWLIYGILFLVALGAAYIISIVYGFNSIEMKPYRIVIFSNFCVIVLVANGVLFGINRMQHLMYCLNEIQKIKKNITNKLTSNSKKLFIDKIYLSLVLITLALGLFTIWLYDSWKVLPQHFRYLLYIFTVLMGYQFIDVALSIYTAVTVINENLQDMLTAIGAECKMEDTQLDNFLKPIDLKIPVQSINAAIDLIGMTDQLYPDIEITRKLKNAEKIRLLTNYFVGTNNVLRKLNSSESFIFLSQFIIFTVDIAITVQNFATVMDNIDDYFNSILLRVLQMIWFMSHVTRIMLVVEPCYQTQEEILNTRYLVGRMMCFVASKVDPLYDELDIFFKQLLLNNFTYTALGICDIGRGLISTIIGASTTLLVLSHQM